MRIPRRSLAIGAAVLACAGAALMSLQAAEQKAPTASKAAAPQSPQKPSAAPAQLPPLPDADTIKDDPTVAPDPKETADHNISMPTDI
jgi:hypothetical protein